MCEQSKQIEDTDSKIYVTCEQLVQIEDIDYNLSVHRD